MGTVAGPTRGPINGSGAAGGAAASGWSSAIFLRKISWMAEEEMPALVLAEAWLSGRGEAGDDGGPAGEDEKEEASGAPGAEVGGGRRDAVSPGKASPSCTIQWAKEGLIEDECGPSGMHALMRSHYNPEVQVLADRP